MKHAKHLLIPLFYLIIRYGFASRLENLGAYAPECFEILFCAFVFLLYREKLRLRFRFSPPRVAELVFSLLMGVGVMKGAQALGLIIPFDLKSPETLVLLLLAGPILEEFLFRQALWFALERVYKGALFTILGTSLLFVFGHFYAYFFVPTQLKSFVIYQSVYVAFIGIWWGWRYSKERSIGLSILLHVLFNLGFYLAF